MKVKVLAVKPLSIADKPDVKGVKLTFEQDGQTRSLSSWIPPVVATVSSWEPGQEQEIEPYTKDGKDRFRIAGQRGPSGQGRYTPDPGRDAVQAAVALAQTAWRIPEGATEQRTGPMAQGAADHMLLFVESAIPRILKAMSSVPGDAGVAQPGQSSAGRQTDSAIAGSNPAPGHSPEPSPASDPVPGPAGCRDGNHLGPFTPAPNERAAERGIVVCGRCQQAGMWKLAEAVS